MSAILPRRRVHIRCSREKCKRRFTLPKHPDEYVRGWKCASCGGARFREIKDRNREAGNNIQCDCAGYQWGNDRTASRPPHRRGSRFCWYRADGSMRMPGDDDFEDPNYEPDEVTDAA